MSATPRTDAVEAALHQNPAEINFSDVAKLHDHAVLLERELAAEKEINAELLAAVEVLLETEGRRIDSWEKAAFAQARAAKAKAKGQAS